MKIGVVATGKSTLHFYLFLWQNFPLLHCLRASLEITGDLFQTGSCCQVLYRKKRQTDREREKSKSKSVDCGLGIAPVQPPFDFSFATYSYLYPGSIKHVLLSFSLITTPCETSEAFLYPEQTKEINQTACFHYLEFNSQMIRRICFNAED